MDPLSFKDMPGDLWKEIDTVDRAKLKGLRKARQPAQGSKKQCTLESRAGWRPVEAGGS